MSREPTYRLSSFSFAQESLFRLPRMSSSRCCGDFVAKMTDMASDRPIQFVALTSFLVLGVVPTGAFLAYAVATIIASIIGVVFFDLFLLAIGVTVLVAALGVVLCVSGGVVSVFAALYYSYRFAVGTVKIARNPWPVSGSTTPADLSESHPDESLDKNKSYGLVGVDMVSEFFELLEQFEGSSDFYRTAIVVLFLSTTVFVMSLMVGIMAYLVVNFT